VEEGIVKVRKKKTTDVDPEKKQKERKKRGTI